MLSGTLLDNDKHGALKAVAAANTGFPRPGAALERASTGLRRYATLRAAAFGNGAGADAPADDNREAFEDARSGVAEGAGHVTQDIPDELIAAIEDLLEPGSAGAGVVRAYWADLGFPEAEVDAYLAEAGAARAGLVDVARLVQTVDDWRAPLEHFGADHPDDMQWGFGFAGEPALHDDARAFVAASRRAGVTPSLYLMTTILLLVDKLAEELARV